MKAREEERREEKTYRLYVADSLFYMHRNSRLADKYLDVLEKNKHKKPVKTGDEIVTDIIRKHNFKFKKGGIAE